MAATIQNGSTGPSASKVGNTGYRELMWIALGCLLCRVAGLFFDATPRFFLGDSASYLETALTGWVPPDRSYLYGLLLRGLFHVWPTLTVVVLVQAFAGALTGVILWAILRVRLRVGRWTSVALTGLFVLDPFILYYERAVMTESLSLLFFTAFIYFLLGALACGGSSRCWYFVAVEICAWGLVLVRQSFLPYVVATLMFTALVVVWRNAKISNGVLWYSKFTRALLLGCCLVVVFMGGLAIYSRVVARLHGCPAQLSRADGYFLSAYYAPIITPELVEDEELRQLIFTDPRYPLTDPEFFLQRMFSRDGMINRILVRYHGDPKAEKNLMLKRIALRALARHPIGAGRIVWRTLCDHFDRTKIKASLRTALSLDRELSDKQKERYHASLNLAYDNSRSSFLTQAVLNSPWLPLLKAILSVVALIGVLIWGGRSAESLLLLAAPFFLLALNCAMTLMDVRYLHAQSLVLLLAAGAVYHSFILTRNRKASLKT